MPHVAGTAGPEAPVQVCMPVLAQAKCPIYVRKSVWEQHSMPLKALVQEGSPAAAKLSAAEEVSGTDALTKIRWVSQHSAVESGQAIPDIAVLCCSPSVLFSRSGETIEQLPVYGALPMVQLLGHCHPVSLLSCKMQCTHLPG